MTDLRNPTDGELLAEFAQTGSDQPFATVVARHAAMVLAVCGQVLGNTADAEDAGQAVFLTLAQKATAMAGAKSVGGWLYRVAWYVATRARARRRIRSDRERQASQQALLAGEKVSCPGAGLEQLELSNTLASELARIGERYRLPIVLHYFQGQSVADGAAMLGWRVGTFASRLARGREILKSRLTRRGVGPSSVTIGASLAAMSKTTVASPTFIASTSKVATLIAAGHGIGSLASAQTLAWTKGALNMIAWAKIKIVAAVCAALILTLGMAVVVAQVETRKTPAMQAATAPARPATNPSLAQQKLQTAREALDLAIQLRARGLGPNTEDICRWQRRVMESELEVATSEQQKSAAMQQYVTQMKEMETRVRQEFRAGVASQLDVDSVAYQRIEAEQLLGGG